MCNFCSNFAAKFETKRMKKNLISLPILTICVVLGIHMVSCQKSTGRSVTYDVTDATIATFAFANEEDRPSLQKAVFIVEDRIDTGLIHMAEKDSVAFGADITKVRPRTSYNGVPSAVIYYMGDTSFIMTGRDTLDCTRRPVYIRVFAADRTHEKWYRLEAYEHSVNPDLYHWQKLTASIVADESSAEQQAFCRTDSLFVYRNDGTQPKLYTSADGAAWTEATPTGLPADCHPRRMVLDSLSGLFCYADPTGIYTSRDGQEFAASHSAQIPEGYTMVTLLLSFDNRIWALLQEQNSQKQAIAYGSLDGEMTPLHPWRMTDATFPVSGFATATFVSKSGLHHGMIAGGYNEQGQILSSVWSIEEQEGNYRITNVSGTNAAFADAAVTQYGGRLLRIGGILADGTLTETGMYSDNEGLTWEEADTSWVLLPDSFGARRRVSLLKNRNDLYLFGGHTQTKCMSDIYKGRLNSIDW